MLHLLLGTDRMAVSDAVIGRITAKAAQGRGGQILIVPEQYSHETERALLAAGGNTVCRYAEVLSFTRLASRAFAVCGGVSAAYLDGGGRLLTMYLAVSQVSKELKYYAAAVGKGEFLLDLCDGVEEFMSYCLTPEMLKNAAGQFTGRFAQKLTELAMIYESYLAVCAAGQDDPVTRQLRLLSILEETDFADGRTFYLDGFSDFTGVQSRLISALLARGCEVTVGLTTDGSDRSIFSTAAETAKQLKKLAAEAGCGADSTRIEADTGREAAVSHLLCGLFDTGAVPFAGQTDAVHFFHADSREEECAAAARTVREALKSGLRARDICIAAPQIELYAPLLKSDFSRAGLPVYYAGSTAVLQKPLIAALLTALQAAERFEYDAVAAYLKSDLSPLDGDAADRLEKYAFFWNLHGSQWTKPLTLHPGGFGEEWKDETREQLAQLEHWREAAIGPLLTLHRAWQAAEDVGGYVRAVADFLEAVGLGDTLAEQTSALLAAGDRQTAQESEQLYDILITALEQADAVLGRQVMPVEPFLHILKMLLGTYPVGTIPAALDAVQVGSLPSFRHKRAELLIVMGAEDGKLPSFAAPAGILTEEDRQRLLACGIRLSPADLSRLDRELGWVYASLSAAQSAIHLSYPGDAPSYLFDRARKLFPNISVTECAAVLFYPDTSAACAAYIAGGETETISSPVLLQCLHELKRRAGFAIAPLEKATVQGLYGREIALSASRIDRLAGCRYAFFLHDGLKLEPWKQAKFDAPVFGTFVHYVLECTVRDVQKAGGFAALDDPAIMALAERHICDYTEKYLTDAAERGDRFHYLFRRNLDEVRAVVQDVSRELRGAKFVPADQELAFSDDAEEQGLPAIRVDTPSGTAKLKGYVDRVDLYDAGGSTYFRVADYKTGRKEFDYAAILQGEGLQMLIYLFALRKYGKQRYGKDIDPAGVLYVPSRYGVERVDPGTDAEAAENVHREAVRRKGLLLHDETVLQAMEGDLEKPFYLPCKVKKGELTGDLASREQLHALEEFVMGKLGSMTEEIFSGTLTPNPIQRGMSMGSCLFCDYQAVCHKDTCHHEERNIKKIGAERFWEEIERRDLHG